MSCCSEQGAWRPAPPHAAVAPHGASATLDLDDLVAEFPRPPGFDTGPSLPARLRGALGDALREIAAAPTPAVARRRAAHGLPSAWEAMFADPPLAPARTGALPHAPCRPYALFAETDGRRVRVTVRMFGRGRVWGPEVLAALPPALSRFGVTVAPLARARARPGAATLTARRCSVARAAWSGETAARWRLVAEAPIAFRRDRSVAFDARAVASSLLSRSAGAMAWCGWRLDVDAAEIASAVSAARMEDAALRPQPIFGYSKRQETSLHLVGVGGAATLANLSPALQALIPIVELVGLGLHTTRGMGRCRFIPVPR